VSRVLVTGASGFIGRHSLRFLVERGHEVHAVARGRLPPLVGIGCHVCDLLDPNQAQALIDLVRPTHLLHLAWYAVPGKFWTAPENDAWVAASGHLVRAFAAAGGRRVVVAGTCAEYDWSHDLLSETSTPLAPATRYGTAKNTLRTSLAAAAPALGLSWAWGRVFFLYGPHEVPGRLVSDVTAGLLAGRRVAVSTGTQERDFMHVADVARAFVTLLDSGFGGPLNVATGKVVPVRDVIERLGTLTGGSELIDFGARPSPPGDPPRLAADVRALTTKVGFTPRYDLARGLQDTVDWWRSGGMP
jgi:nucleoside-diphosphate-sugar epimerase